MPEEEVVEEGKNFITWKDIDSKTLEVMQAISGNVDIINNYMKLIADGLQPTSQIITSINDAVSFIKKERGEIAAMLALAILKLTKDTDNDYISFSEAELNSLQNFKFSFNSEPTVGGGMKVHLILAVKEEQKHE